MRVQAWRGGLFLVLLVSMAAAGCHPAEPETQPAQLPKVTVSHPIVRELVDEDEYSGWLQASKTVEVRSRVRGHIQKIQFKDGDLVKQDQLLFELDPRPFQAAIDETLANAKALESQQNAAEKDLARYKILIRQGATTQQELDKVEADALAYAARTAAKMQEAERFKLDLEYSRITAPIAGRIGRAMLTEGNLVNAGGSDPLLATIVAVDPVYAYFTIDERSLQRYQKLGREESGEKAKAPLREQKLLFRFGLDSDEGFPHQGLLDFADNKVDASTGTIEVRGTVKNAKGQFVPGSRVRVRIPVSDKYPALLVPDTAVLTDQDKKYLLVLGPDNKVLRRDVSLGKLLEDGQRVILPASQAGQGIQAGDWVITLGLQRARVNYPVEPLDSGGQPVAAGS